MQNETLDDFEDLSDWTAIASGQAQLSLLRLKLSGDSPFRPSGVIVVQPPLPRPILQVEADAGKRPDFAAESFTVRAVPAKLMLRF